MQEGLRRDARGAVPSNRTMPDCPCWRSSEQLLGLASLLILVRRVSSDGPRCVPGAEGTSLRLGRGIQGPVGLGAREGAATPERRPPTPAKMEQGGSPESLGKGGRGAALAEATDRSGVLACRLGQQQSPGPGRALQISFVDGRCLCG